MSDNTVTFKDDGTYKRGVDVQPLDVQKTVEHAAEQETTAPTPVKQVASKPASGTSAPPKPGTFSLNSLKATIKSVPTPPVMPTQPAPTSDPVEPAKSSDEVQAMELREDSKDLEQGTGGVSVMPEPSEVTVDSTAVGTGAAVDESKEEEPPVEEKPVEKFELGKVDEAVYHGDSEESTSTQVGESMPTQDISLGHVDHEVKEKEKASTKTGKSKSKARPTLDQLMQGAKPVAPLEIEQPKITEPAVQEMKLEQAKSTSASEVAQETTFASQGAQELKLEQAALGSPRATDQSSTVDQLKSVVDGTGVETFNVLPLRDLFQLIDVNWSEACTWLKRCISKRSSAPAAIFVPKFNDELRFYNFFSLSSPVAVGVVVGAREGISAGRLNMKSGTLEDISSALHTEGNFVLTNTGAAVAVYSERKAGTMTI